MSCVLSGSRGCSTWTLLILLPDQPVDAREAVAVAAHRLTRLIQDISTVAAQVLLLWDFIADALRETRRVLVLTRCGRNPV